MEGGDEQTMLIAPEKVSSSGAFAISRKLAGLHRGDYVVNVSVPWEEAAAKERTKESESPTGGATTKEAVRASIDEAMKRLPKGYKIVENPAGGFMATPDSLRPGLPIAWDDRHKTWMPP
jgi:hypothetical protein